MMTQMPGLGTLAMILCISSIPAIAALIWFRLKRWPFSWPRFAFSLLAGATAVFPALLLQEIIPFGGRWAVLARAFTEELSRLPLLAILFFAFSRFRSAAQHTVNEGNAFAQGIAGASGFVSGLGFALLETTVYGASNPFNALLRILTTAPMHAACGFRVGSSIAQFKQSPARASAQFLSAVVIHSAYNLMLEIPGSLPPIAAVLIALSACASAVQSIWIDMKKQ